MEAILALVTAHGSDLMAIVTGVIAVASAVANLTKTDSDNKAVAAISKLVNLLALNLKK